MSSTYLCTNVYNGVKVHRYRSDDTTEEEREEIIRTVLTHCAKYKMRQMEKEGASNEEDSGDKKTTGRAGRQNAKGRKGRTTDL